MRPDFSAIIPTFRRRVELAEAIRSVLAQDDVTIEILVIDDCADGSARDVVEGFRDARIFYHLNPVPTGGVPSIVRNLAWPQAQGDYVHFLDDDDRVPEGHYREVKSVFAAHPEIGLVFGQVAPFGDGPEEQLTHEKAFFRAAAHAAGLCGRFGTKLPFAARMVFGLPLLVCSAGVVRRDCLARAGGFDPDIRLMEDVEFFTRVMRTCGAHFLPRTAVQYRIGYPSLMHSPNPSEAQRSAERDGVRRLQAKYRRERGTIEFYCLAVFARWFLRFLCSLSPAGIEAPK